MEKDCIERKENNSMAKKKNEMKRRKEKKKRLHIHLLGAYEFVPNSDVTNMPELVHTMASVWKPRNGRNIKE